MSDKPKTQILKPELFVSENKFYAPKVSSLSPLPNDHPFYAMAGRVASQWSHLEHRLDTIIWGLSGSNNDKTACITAQILGVPGRCRAILALGTLVGISKPLLKKTNALLNDSHAVAQERNRIVHDPWYLESTAGVGKPAQFKTVPYGLKEITEAEIEKTISRIKNLESGASDLKGKIFAELKTLREKRG